MFHEQRVIFVVIAVVLILITGRRLLRFIARYAVQVTAPLFGNRWHGFPSVHRVKRITGTKEWFTGEKIEIFGGGVRAESIRKKSKTTDCAVCGKTISEEPLGKFVYTSRGEDVQIA